MAEIYAQVLEANGYTVERNLEIGPRPQTYPALEGGEFDMMPEYIGSLLEFINQGAGEATNDPEETHTALNERLEPAGLTALGYTQATDNNAFVMRPATAQSLGITRMSDLAAHQNELTWGLPPECATNPLCGGALSEAYGIDMDAIEIVELGACGGEIATALSDDAEEAGLEPVDIGELCSTQPDIARLGLTVLEDDKGTQPAENIAPVFRNEWLDSAGGAETLAAILDPVSEAMTTETLTELNVRVGSDPPEDYDVVASEWLEAEGLLP